MKISLKKNIMYNSIGSFVNMFSQWIITVLVIRLSGEAASGVLALAMSFGSIFLIIAAFGVKTYQVSDVTEKYSDQEYIGSKIFTGGLGLLVLFSWIGFSSYYPEEKFAAVLYVIYMLIYSYADVLYGVHQRKWRLDLAGKSMCIRSIFTLSCFIVIQLMFQNINITILCMIVVSFLVLLFYDFPKTRNLTDIRPKLNRSVIKNLLWECFPLALYAFLHTLVLTVPKLFLREFHGQEFLGIYNPIMAPITVISVVAGFLINPMVTVFAAHYHSKKTANLLLDFFKCVLLLIILLILSLVGVFFFGNIILDILLGGGKRIYAYLLQPMVVVAILTSFAILIGNLSVVIRDVKGLIISGAVGFVTAVVSSYYYVKEYNMIGTCYALILALVIQILILGTFASVRIYRKHKMGA